MVVTFAIVVAVIVVSGRWPVVHAMGHGILSLVWPGSAFCLMPEYITAHREGDEVSLVGGYGSLSAMARGVAAIAARRQGHWPFTSTSSDQLRNVRTTTIRPRTPTL